jgi:hypothetical protein
MHSIKFFFVCANISYMYVHYRIVLTLYDFRLQINPKSQKTVPVNNCHLKVYYRNVTPSLIYFYN